jgi:hypothetical protein
MHIELDISQQPWQVDELTVTIVAIHTRNNRDYHREVASFVAPKYQAIAMQRALKGANPEDYKSAPVLKLVTSENDLTMG